MGLILLVGLIVKNGIILLDFTRHRMLAGLPLDEAIVEAARVRLRPILMTTLCTLFGLLPLALGLGAGSEMQKPLALAVIGGLALSTPITLYLVPTLLVAIRGPGFTLGQPTPEEVSHDARTEGCRPRRPRRLAARRRLGRGAADDAGHGQVVGRDAGRLAPREERQREERRGRAPGRGEEGDPPHGRPARLG